MPNIKSAKKKVRQDKKRAKRNAGYRNTTKNVLRLLVTSTIAKAYSAIDKAVKKKVIHKNKAARLKARVSKLKTKK